MTCRFTIIFIFAGIGQWILAGCVDSALDCPPGLQVTCPCAAGKKMGVQVCSEDGASWGDCRGCPNQAVCEPGELQSCACAGGGTGVQECADDGVRWGDCQDCEGSSDGDADSDTDSDADTDCAYNDCEGDICTDLEGCCAESGCSSWYYTSTDNFIENYCYPMCDVNADDDPCKCGDVCVDLSGLQVCLGTGHLTLDSLTVPVGADSNTSVQIDASEVDFTAEHDGETVSLEFFEANWYEYTDGSKEVDIWSQGLIDSNTAWILAIYIPEDTFNQGEGEYPLYDESTETTNFYLELYTGIYDSSNKFTEAWRENIPNSESSTLTIGKTCAACADGSDSCEDCVFSADVSWFAMRSKVSLN